MPEADPVVGAETEHECRNLAEVARLMVDRQRKLGTILTDMLRGAPERMQLPALQVHLDEAHWFFDQIVQPVDVDALRTGRRDGRRGTRAGVELQGSGFVRQAHLAIIDAREAGEPLPGFRHIAWRRLEEMHPPIVRDATAEFLSGIAIETAGVDENLLP